MEERAPGHSPSGRHTARSAPWGLHSHLSASQTGKGTLRQREGLAGGGGVLKPTLSQSSRSRSTRILISSGMAKEGWVSFSWMATCGEGVWGSVRGPHRRCDHFAPSAPPPRAHVVPGQSWGQEPLEGQLGVGGGGSSQVMCR